MAQRSRAYISDTLVPVLKPGEAVILDNLQFQEIIDVREATEATGSQLLYHPRPTRPT